MSKGDQTVITREFLTDRLKELIAARNKLQGDVNANSGGIMVYQQLIGVLDLEEQDKAGASAKEAADKGEENTQPNGETESMEATFNEAQAVDAAPGGTKRRVPRVLPPAVTE